MARTQNLSEYLTDIATAIKTKKSDETPINASKFDEEIANLPSGGDDVYNYIPEKINYTTSDYIMLNCKIKKIPFIDISGSTTMSRAFMYWSALETIPLLDTSKATAFMDTFRECKSLKTIPLLDTSKATGMDGMFRTCSVLETVPLLDTSNVTNMSGMFTECYMLTSIPKFNTNKNTSFNGTFSNCRKLHTVPLLNANKVTSVYNAFSNCSELTNFEGFENLGQACTTSTSANSTGFTFSLNSSSKLTYESLTSIINNLYDIASMGYNTQKLILGTTNKNKLTAEEINLATQKGWTVS